MADPAGSLVYLGVEHPDAIYEFDFVAGVVTREFDLTNTLTGPSESGLEALTFVDDPAHPEGGRFYAGHQDDGRIYVFDLPIATSMTSTTVQHVSTIVPVEGRDDLSGLDWDAANSMLYAVFDGHDLLRTMERDGQFINEWSLPGTSQEGIALAECTLFVTQDTLDEVWHYRFPTNTADVDADGVFDCVDNCPDTSNDRQADLDSDGAGDSCDCAPEDPSASELPSAVEQLRLSRDAGQIRLSWSGDVSGSDVAWGRGSDLRLVTSLNDALCLQDDIPGNMATDTTAAPSSSDFHYYLVRRQNACGSGSYGTGQGVERSLPAACP